MEPIPTMIFAVILAGSILLAFVNLSSDLKRKDKVIRRKDEEIQQINEKMQGLREECSKKQQQIEILQKELGNSNQKLATHEENLRRFLESNLTSIPWLAGMMADYLTYDIEMKAKYLDWGYDMKRLKKVESIREIRAEAKELIEQSKEAVYQLEYLKQLYPGLEDVLSTDYREIAYTSEIPARDPIRNYLSDDEWKYMSEDGKNQLALDRYVQSRRKSNWQIGRDYELSVAYEYMQQGYIVDTYGSRKGLEDLGRDLIATRDDLTLIIQCKYWSEKKTIREKHLFQLYGTTITYQIEHPELTSPPRAVFVTNIELSDIAYEVAKLLHISVFEHHEMRDFPRIKCNIGHDEHGTAKIYHLPMDAQYDITQIKKPGEFYAFTVREATQRGFRRAYKWHGAQ